MLSAGKNFEGEGSDQTDLYSEGNWLPATVRKRGGVRKSMGNKVPWKTGTLIYLPATARPLISLQKEAVLSPCNFATAHLTACILNFYLPLTPPFFVHPFFCPVRPNPSPRNFLPQNPLFLGPQIYSFSQRKGNLQGLGFGVWKILFFSGARKKVSNSLKTLNSLISGSEPFLPYFPSDY